MPAAFVFNAVTVDDASNRALGNNTYAYDIGSNAIVVPDAYRALNDPRVPWKDALKKAQDTGLEYYQQLKYTGYATPIRVASGLEASYIAAEAQLQTGNSAAALTLIASRRTANGQPAFTGTTGRGDSRRAHGPARARVLARDEALGRLAAQSDRDAVRRRGGNAVLQARAGGVRQRNVLPDSDLGDHGQSQFPEDVSVIRGPKRRGSGLVAGRNCLVRGCSFAHGLDPSLRSG